MKAVLMSIQPKWVFLIIAKKMGWDIGKEKKLEVRKTRPNDTIWNRQTIIYCSKDKKSFNRIPKEYQPLMAKFLGKVIGEFTCDSVYEWNYRQLQVLNETINTYFPIFAEDLPKTCLTHKDIENYGKGKTLYAWHISDLKIYGKPRELSEFGNLKRQPIQRAFQSWGYCYEKEN